MCQSLRVLCEDKNLKLLPNVGGGCEKANAFYQEDYSPGTAE
jgi:hypothetical protein